MSHTHYGSFVEIPAQHRVAFCTSSVQRTVNCTLAAKKQICGLWNFRNRTVSHLCLVIRLSAFCISVTRGNECSVLVRRSPQQSLQSVNNSALQLTPPFALPVDTSNLFENQSVWNNHVIYSVFVRYIHVPTLSLMYIKRNCIIMMISVKRRVEENYTTGNFATVILTTTYG
jgi:hypothetical protein